jgi:hypothetical protein
MDDDQMRHWDDPMTNSEVAILMVIYSVSAVISFWVIHWIFFG